MAHGTPDTLLPDEHLPPVSAIVPFLAHMQPICHRGTPAAWPVEGNMVGHTPYFAVSSLGWQRLRSGPVGPFPLPDRYNHMPIDLHSHRSAPYPQGIISRSVAGNCAPSAFDPDQCWSAGIHPWDYLSDDLQARQLALEKAVRLEQVVAVGETGIDLNGKRAAAPLAIQMALLRYHALTAESAAKPLILHAVKAHVQIIGMHKELRPRQPWIIHGFRSRPSIAELYLNEGICLSFGERFNADSMRITPHNMRFAETDESSLSINEIIALQAAASGLDTGELISILQANMAIFQRKPGRMNPEECR